MAATTHPTSSEAGRPKSTTSTPISLATLWRAVKRYSLLMFIFALLAAAASALVYFFLPLPKYTGRVIYLVNQNPEYNLSPNVWAGRDSANYRQLQANVIVNRLVLNVAVSEPGVSTLPIFEQDKTLDPVQYLQSNLRVDFSTGSEHMRVTLEGNDQSELMLILKAIHSAYTREVVQKEQQKRTERMATLQKLQNEYRDKVKTIRNNIQSVLTATGSADPLTQQIKERFLNSVSNQSDAELLRIGQRQRELTLQLKMYEDEKKLPLSMRKDVPPQLVDNYVENDKRMRDLRNEYDGIVGGLTRYQDLLKPGAIKPQPVVDLETKKVDLEARINSSKEQLTKIYKKTLSEEMAKGQDILITSIRNQLDLLNEQKQAVMKELNEVIKQLNSFKTQIASVAELQTEMSNAESISLRINNELVTMQTEINAKSRVELWDPPNVVPGIEGNRRIKYSALSGLAFIVLGLALAQWLEIRHRRIQSLDEVTAGLGLQVLGTVPAVPKGGAAARSNWPHLLTEAVNTTRTMLLSGPNSESTKTLLVTSAMSGEGKTSLTTHLAVSLASAGRRVLLIDADMRRPAVHKVLGLPSKPGLAELLMGTATMTEVSLVSKIPGLHLVPAGTYTREAAASLSTERFSAIVREAAIGYDFVLVDSPPILPVADALAIAKNVDGVLISVMQDLSRYGAVQTACQRLNMVGANVLGVVVSGVKTTGGYYYYYYDERYSKPPNPQATPQVTAVTPAAPPAATVS